LVFGALNRKSVTQRGKIGWVSLRQDELMRTENLEKPRTGHLKTAGQVALDYGAGVTATARQDGHLKVSAATDGAVAQISCAQGKMLLNGSR
jgi:hypothetical protein